jgi:Lon-like protease
MTQRTLAAVIALPLVVVLVVLAWVLPLPYTIYRPGPTVDVLAKIKVDDASVKTYPDPGSQIRMTTVNETLPSAHLGLWSLLGAWISRDAAVYPKSVAYPEADTTDTTSQQEGAQEMTGAQEAATQVALEELGYHVFQGAKIASVVTGGPADGRLRKDDVVTAVGSRQVSTSAEFVSAVQGLTPGRPATFSVTRGGKSVEVTITPSKQGGTAHLGVSIADAVKMPFNVDLGIPEAIGGPSAGLMMTIAIYDYLTPGSLTGDQPIAGTGTISQNGAVGPIGGIQQKIPAAKDAGAKIFLVPADNCEDVAGSDHGSMRLIKVTSFDDALSSIQTWVKDPSAQLPTCGGAS